jgi:hypothetical protein
MKEVAKNLVECSVLKCGIMALNTALFFSQFYKTCRNFYFERHYFKVKMHYRISSEKLFRKHRIAKGSIIEIGTVMKPSSWW